MVFTQHDLYMSDRTEYEVIGMVQNQNGRLQSQLQNSAANDFQSQAGIRFDSPYNEVDAAAVKDILASSSQTIKNQIMDIVGEGSGSGNDQQRKIQEGQKQKRIQALLEKEYKRLERMLIARVERAAFQRHLDAQKRKEDAMVAQSMAKSSDMSTSERDTLTRVHEDRISGFNSLA